MRQYRDNKPKTLEDMLKQLKKVWKEKKADLDNHNARQLHKRKRSSGSSKPIKENDDDI